MTALDSAGSTDITTLYIVRHGESFDNAGIPYERTPEGSPLTERGRRQALEVARQLSGIHADAVIASDLLRARQTAEIIAHDRGLQVVVVPELHERSIGIYGGIPNLEQHEQYRDQFAAYRGMGPEERMRWKLGAEWESLEEARGRFVATVERVAHDFRHRTAIVVAHGTVMRMFLVHLGFGTQEQLDEGSVDNTGYLVVQTDGSAWRLTGVHGVRRRAEVGTGSGHEE